jgi:lipopolysaccharide biosynthesis glycosyltransferase
LYENFINHFLNIISHKRFVVSAFTLEAFAIKYDRDGNEYDRIVYLDVDQIVEGDISLLFTTDKDIVAAPGDNVIFNVDGNTLLQRNRESVSGGLFSISPKYLGESVRNEIIKRGEEFIYKYVDNLPWSGIGFEMDVLNVWLLDKDTWITSSTYAYPSMFYKNTLVENASNIIKYELFRTSRIIHIWDEKPWTKSRENCDGKIDLYWWHIYDSLKNGKNPKPLKEFFHDEIDDKVSFLYQLYALNRNERNTWELLDGTLQK